MAGVNSLDGVKMKIKTLQQQADAAENRAAELERAVRAEESVRAQAEAKAAQLRDMIAEKEEKLDNTLEQLNNALRRLEEAEKVADESKRGTRVIESRAVKELQRLGRQEDQLREAKMIAESADRKFEEATNKFVHLESEMDKLDEHAKHSEFRAKQLEEELRLKSAQLQSLKAGEKKYVLKENKCEDELKMLRSKLREYENRADVGQKNVTKLEQQVDYMEEQLIKAKEENMEINRVLDQTLNELNSI
ncbi:tropomyosin alpha-4 chain-like [Lethenteron reissneri]|uniref:tropomyosin alpha-4 chain-like n=1 Tax=Lethenteron reissneri TaxID=7753 RepID=UPI002AB764DE|nr:tropomyosin alpha-4 chain-like [Lethenteron reissneri]